MKYHIVLKRRNSCSFAIKLREPLTDKREEIDFDLDCPSKRIRNFDGVKTLPDSPTRLTIPIKSQIFDGTEVMLQPSYPRNITLLNINNSIDSK